MTFKYSIKIRYNIIIFYLFIFLIYTIIFFYILLRDKIEYLSIVLQYDKLMYIYLKQTANKLEASDCDLYILLKYFIIL